MATCFIFTQHCDEEQSLCLRLDQNGQVDAPLALRPLQEVRALQTNARTIVVIPTESSSLCEIDLPWLGERKARAAIPYALEEQLAQNVLTLHFAFDRQHYQDNRYLVVITDKQYLLDIIAKLGALNLNFDMITLDWFALKENEACVTERGILVRDNVFKGVLSGELASIYLSNQEKSSSIMLFSDSEPLKQATNHTSVDSLTSVWIAQRLLQADPMNLCQGDLQHGKSQHASRHWYLACASLVGAWLISLVLMNAIYLHSLNTQLADLDKKTAVIYHEFFPEASQVISPKFRISQLLKTGATNGDTSTLWSLLVKLADASKGGSYTIEQFRFQNQVLSVTLVSKDFAALENLQSRLQQANVKVTQAQAASHEHKVVATLELENSK